MSKYLTALLVGMLAAAPVLAIEDAFELDGNPQDDPNISADDWETLYFGGGSQTAYTFINDFVDDDIFTGGGSKTPNLVEQWLWKNFTPPDKTDIVNASVANYDVKGEQVIYFQAGLLAPNGDAELAIWILQDDVGKNPDGTFHGSHVEGDVYIASKFSNGGRNSQIAIYEWDSSCSKGVKDPIAGDCAAANLRTVTPFVDGTCTGKTTAGACAITNVDPVDAVWPYQAKGEEAGFYPPTTFFEGGINIFSLFGQNLCFSSVVLMSGASTSFTSTAKDFALGDFNVCSVDASKTCVNDDLTDDVPAAITYDVRGCAYNDGGATLTVDGLTNSLAGGADYVPADLAWFDPPVGFDPALDCGNAAKLLDAVTNGTVAVDFDLGAGEALVYQFSETTDINAVSDEVTIAASSGSALIDPDFAQATCPPRTFNASLKASKSCEAALEDVGSMLAVRMDVSGKICNDGEVDLTLTSVVDTVADGVVVFDPIATTIPKGQCVPYLGSYYPESIPTGDLCPFSDMVTVTVTTPVNTAGADCTGEPGGPQTCVVKSNAAKCELRVGDGDGDCATGLPNP